MNENDWKLEQAKRVANDLTTGADGVTLRDILDGGPMKERKLTLVDGISCLELRGDDLKELKDYADRILFALGEGGHVKEQDVVNPTTMESLSNRIYFLDDNLRSRIKELRETISKVLSVIG